MKIAINEGPYFFHIFWVLVPKQLLSFSQLIIQVLDIDLPSFLFVNPEAEIPMLIKEVQQLIFIDILIIIEVELVFCF